VNDHDPVFSQSTYRAELIENNYVGAAVLQVARHCRPSATQPTTTLHR